VTGAPQSDVELLHIALAEQKAGRSDAAAAICRQILAHSPDQPHALLLLGLIEGRRDPAAGAALVARYVAQAPNDPDAIYNLGMLQQRAGDYRDALATFERSLALRPDFAPAHHGMAVTYQEQGRLDEAGAAFERAVRQAPTDPVLRNNFGGLRHSQGRLTEALNEFDIAIALDPNLAMAHCNRGIVVRALGWPGESIPALRRALALDPELVKAYLELAEALETTEPEEAQRNRTEAVRRRRVIPQPCVPGPAEARVLILCSDGRGDVSTQFLFDRKRFDKIHAFLVDPNNAPGADAAELDAIPPFDIVFSAIADADRGERYVADATALIGRFDRPVLNPPERILATRRDRVATALADIPGLAVPATRRLARAELAPWAAAQSSFARPQVVRPIGSHGGEGLERLEQPSELTRYLESMPFDTYYLSDYWDFRSDDGHFRKYRLIFVDGEVYPYHLAIGGDWKLHYWRVDMDATLKREEESFLADYRSVFAGEAGDAIRIVAQRLGLDYAGIDCARLADGRVLLFETNANMLVHLNDPADVYPYKHQYVPRIFEAIAAMVKRRAFPG
jgi:Tfp pilus assembly protein PilF/glutathione synthase/RimK-type ligase-like ATP-grasp enzyme